MVGVKFELGAQLGSGSIGWAKHKSLRLVRTEQKRGMTVPGTGASGMFSVSGDTWVQQEEEKSQTLSPAPKLALGGSGW